MPNDNIDTAEIPAPAAAAADTSAAAPAPAADTAAPAAEAAAPKTMLEAIEATLPAADKPVVETPAAAAVAAEPAAPVLDKDGKPVEPAAEPVADDETKMPEGLSAKAQERFQKLANTNKELSSKYEQVTQAVEPFRKALQDNGVQREQFDQAASVIGMMNRGDLPGALAVLDEQRRMIALAMGKSLPGVDALQGFDDLRQAVDQFQITEDRAIEIARSRGRENAQRQQQERHQTQQQTQQREQQDHVQGVQAVDKYCAELAKSDLDYPKIEKILLGQIQGIISGVHPSHWQSKVEAAYKLIKETGSANRQVTQTTQTLRPHGGGSPSTAPQTMHEAMWGGQ